MPTKPHKNAKAYLDEAVAKSTAQAKPISHRRAIISGFAGIFCGFSGIHNMLMYRKKRGFVHLLLSTAALALVYYPFRHALYYYVRCRQGIECIDMSSFTIPFNVMVISGFALFVISVIWGVVEGVIILVHHKRFATSD